jgi:glyoxylase-like metal-dependent hydrolase (beta-lactamase superfamily II)
MGRLAVFCRLGCAVVLGGAGLWSGGVLAAGHCAEVPWLRVAPGIWVWAPAQVEDVSEANGGFVAPVTALVDRGEALVIDPGPSHRHGLRVRESLRCRFGARVTAVVNTHAHAENVLGNSAFADLQASGLLRIWAAAGTQVAMRARCAQCLEGLTHSAGREALRGTRWVVPDAALVPGDELVVGRHRVQVMAVEQGHTEADLVLRHSATGVVWAGGLVYDGRLPELAQGGLLPWLEALDRLHALAPRLLVSASVSRSAPGGESLHSLAATHDYLDALRVRVLAAMDQGLSPWDAQQLELSRFALWAGYAQRHHFNVQRAWRELEPVWMNRSPESAQQVGW